MLHRLAALRARIDSLGRDLRRLAASDTGATAIEYGLLLSGITVFIMIAVFAMGDALDNLFSAVQTKLANSYS